MQKKYYIEHLIDKSNWIDGIWKEEPDLIFWIDENTLYPCIIRRAFKLFPDGTNVGSGGLCGYVGVNKNHPLFGKGYLECPDIHVHGSLTFANKFYEQIDINQLPNINNMWYFGFDCMHESDYSPYLHTLLSKYDFHNRKLSEYETYRDVNYVKKEIESLAKQLKDIEDEQS